MGSDYESKGCHPHNHADSTDERRHISFAHPEENSCCIAPGYNHSNAKKDASKERQWHQGFDGLYK